LPCPTIRNGSGRQPSQNHLNDCIQSHCSQNPNGYSSVLFIVIATATPLVAVCRNRRLSSAAGSVCSILTSYLILSLKTFGLGKFPPFPKSNPRATDTTGDSAGAKPFSQGSNYQSATEKVLIDPFPRIWISHQKVPPVRPQHARDCRQNPLAFRSSKNLPFIDGLYQQTNKRRSSTYLSQVRNHRLTWHQPFRTVTPAITSSWPINI
jgi:hypothetical protein